jgi:hypothetical protein
MRVLPQRRDPDGEGRTRRKTECRRSGGSGCSGRHLVPLFRPHSHVPGNSKVCRGKPIMTQSRREFLKSCGGHYCHF